MRNVVRAAAAAAAGLLVLAGTATAAEAAQFTKTCNEAPGTTLESCVMAIPDFPGGTISVDVDANGTGTGHWILMYHGSIRTCETDYDLKAPAQSWICNGLRSGNYTLVNVVQINSTWSRQGVRW
jgi:hypothetical protein